MRLCFVKAYALLLIACLSSSSAFAQALGVAACDQFFTSYEACANAQVSPQKEALNKASSLMRALMQGRIARGDDKAGLEQECNKMIEAMKAQTAALGCKW